MPPRLARWDYGAHGAYFITTCTHRRRPLFGVVDGDGVLLSPLGRLAHGYLSQVFVGVGLDDGVEAAVVMPDHVHFIVERGATDVAEPPIDLLVRDFKARVTHEARVRRLLGDGQSLWQRGFFDRIIRTDQEHDALRAYIETNPLRWTLKRRGMAL